MIKVRSMYVLEDWAGYKPGIVGADTKMWFKNFKDGERVAVVPDDVRDARQALVGFDDD